VGFINITATKEETPCFALAPMAPSLNKICEPVTGDASLRSGTVASLPAARISHHDRSIRSFPPGKFWGGVFTFRDILS
jgi:hypothetical protein